MHSDLQSFGESTSSLCLVLFGSILPFSTVRILHTYLSIMGLYFIRPSGIDRISAFGNNAVNLNWSLVWGKK